VNKDSVFEIEVLTKLWTKHGLNPDLLLSEREKGSDIEIKEFTEEQLQER